MAVSINWIPVEERLPDVGIYEEVTYVTCENPDTGERWVMDCVCLDIWYGVYFFNDKPMWLMLDEDPYDSYDDRNEPFESKNRRVIAWSKDIVDILPY